MIAPPELKEYLPVGHNLTTGSADGIMTPIATRPARI